MPIRSLSFHLIEDRFCGYSRQKLETEGEIDSESDLTNRHDHCRAVPFRMRFGQDQVRQALEQHAERIIGAANKKAAAEVVNLKK